MCNLQISFFCYFKRISRIGCHNQLLHVSLSKKDILAFSATLTYKTSLSQRQGKFKDYIRFNTSKHLEL
jgi:hypothetical protein